MTEMKNVEDECVSDSYSSYAEIARVENWKALKPFVHKNKNVDINEHV